MFVPGKSYRFLQDDSTNSTHQIKFYLSPNKVDVDGNSSLYENGVTYNGTAGSAGAYTQIDVSMGTPSVLYYQCVNHGLMGNQVNVLGSKSFDGDLSYNVIKLPSGTTNMRPTSIERGVVRYNTTTDQFEGYGAGDAWGSLGGVIDVDQDTYIKAETAANDDNDQLQFFTAGTQRMIIGNNGDISMNHDLKLNSDSGKITLGLDDDVIIKHDGTDGLDIDSAGALSLNSSAGAINLGDDAVTGAINIGSGASARTITVGNDASTKVDVNALAIELDAGATGMVLNSAGTLALTSTDALTLNDGIAQLSLAGTGATSISGATTLDVDATDAVNIDTTDTTNGIKLGTSTSAVPITIGHTTSEVTIADNLTVDGTTNFKDNVTIDANNIAFGVSGLPSYFNAQYGNNLSLVIPNNTNNALRIATTSSQVIGLKTGTASEFNIETVTTNVTGASGLVVSQDTSVGNRLFVTNAIDANSTADIADTLTLSKASGTGLSVTSDATVGGILTVTGAIDANSTADIADTLTLSKASGTGLSVTSDATVGGILTVTGAIDANSTADIADTLTLSKASGTGLSVTSDATVGGDLTVTGNLSTTGNSSLGGSYLALGTSGQPFTINMDTNSANGLTFRIQNAANNAFVVKSSAGDFINLSTGSTTSNLKISSVTTTVAGTKGLIVDNDASISKRLFVTGAIDANSTADIADTLTLSKASGTGLAVTSDATIGGNLTITGDFTVNGTTTTVSTTNTTVSDSLIELSNGATGTPSNDAGIIIERGTSTNAFMGWDESEDKFVLGTTTATGASTGDLTITEGKLKVSELEGTIKTAAQNDITTMTGLTAIGTSGTYTVFAGDASFNEGLSVLGDASFNKGIYMYGDVSWNPSNIAADSIPSSAIIGGVGSSNFTTDVSMNEELFVAKDVSLNQRIFISGDISMNMGTFIQQF